MRLIKVDNLLAYQPLSSSSTLINHKKTRTCKPDSVAPGCPGGSAIYLTPVVAGRRLRCLPPLYHPRATGVPAGYPVGRQGVHGISTRKVYPPRQLPAPVVRSYHTFSPLPQAENRHAAVIFCDTFCTPPKSGIPSVRRCGALCCPDFPPRKATERSAAIF